MNGHIVSAVAGTNCAATASQRRVKDLNVSPSVLQECVGSHPASIIMSYLGKKTENVVFIIPKRGSSHLSS